MSHFWSFGASRRGHFPSLAGAPLRFIGAKRPSLREGYLPAAQLPTQGTTEMRGGRLALVRSHIPKIGPGNVPPHFALVRSLTPVLHRKFGSDRLFFSDTPYLDLEVGPGPSPRGCPLTKAASGCSGAWGLPFPLAGSSQRAKEDASKHHSKRNPPRNPRSESLSTLQRGA